MHVHSAYERRIREKRLAIQMKQAKKEKAMFSEKVELARKIERKTRKVIRSAHIYRHRTGRTNTRLYSIQLRRSQTQSQTQTQSYSVVTVQA